MRQIKRVLDLKNVVPFLSPTGGRIQLFWRLVDGDRSLLSRVLSLLHVVAPKTTQKAMQRLFIYGAAFHLFLNLLLVLNEEGVRLKLLIVVALFAPHFQFRVVDLLVSKCACVLQVRQFVMSLQKADPH